MPRATPSARPGTASARPGTASARPGTASARPGTASARPGTASARPGTASRPGLQLRAGLIDLAQDTLRAVRLGDRASLLGQRQRVLATVLPGVALEQCPLVEQPGPFDPLIHAHLSARFPDRARPGLGYLRRVRFAGRAR